MGFMHGQLADSKHYRLFNTISDFKREELIIEVALSLSSLRIIRVLEQLLEWRNKPIAIRCDYGLPIEVNHFQTKSSISSTLMPLLFN